MAEIKIKIEDLIYEKATKLFDELGIDLDTAINLFLRQSVYHRELPFKLKLPAEVIEEESNGDPIIDDILT